MEHEFDNMVLTGSEEPAAPAAPAPSPETPAPTEEKPTEPVTPVTDPKTPETPAAEILYDLPDGRKVTADVLQKEWKENFLPDYTRKSQKIAEIERGKAPINNDPKDTVPKWKDPTYVPENYAEVIEIAKAEAIQEIIRGNEAQARQVQEVTSRVEAELAEIKKADPNLDENALFVHATKYGFQDLKVAHANMKDMRAAVVQTEQRVVKNIKSREADPVSAGASGGGTVTDGFDPGMFSKFESASDYLASLKGGK